MAKVIKLTNVDFTTSKATVSIGDAAYTDVTVDGTGEKVIVGGYGTFDASNKDAVVFTADASLNGEVELVASSVGGATAKLTVADFSKATAGVKIATTTDMLTVTSGAGNDTIVSAQTGGVINAGAGNDIVSITGGTDNVTLGAGADTLELTGGKATVADYNYYEGDVIKTAATGVALSDNGKLTIATDSVTASKVALKDNWYAAKVIEGANVVDYFTAVGGNNVNVTKDLSKSVVANVVNASGAQSANITLGHGKDTVTLSSGVDTVVVGKSAGHNVTDIKSNDVIAIDGVKLANISLTAGTTNTASVAVNYAASTVETGVATTGGSLKFNDGSKTHKLAFDKLDAPDGANAIKYATASNADWVLGAANGKSTLEVGDTTHLHDTSKYKNITNISVASGLDLKAPISLTGATGKANKIDATNAKVGVAVWGFSSGTDTIALSTANKAQDTVWFGAGDGNDTISGFAYGTASDSDVLYLKDTKTLKDIDVAFNTDKAKFTVGKAVASVSANTVTGSSDVAQIKLADEKTYKVAGEYTAADGVTINTDDIDGLDYYAFAGDKKAKAVTITGSKDWIVNSLYTDFYTTGATIATLDASGATGNVTLAAAASIKGGTGTNNIWTYQSDKAAAVTLSTGAGTDIIWFAENADKDVTVTKFEADRDVVKFATAQSLKEIAEGYTFASAGASQATITGATNTDSKLILDKNGTINLVDGSDKAYKAMVINGGGTAAFSTDVNIYAGMDKLTVGGSVEGTVEVRVGKESRGLSSDTYFIDNSVTTFDASKSTATFWIAGNANEATTINGGLTENYLYGGGAASDALYGSVAAKDTFYFGTGDGTDEIRDGVDKEDTIALWNVEDADIANVKVSINTSNKVEISLSDYSKLTITDANGATALTDGLTFTSASQTAYTYDSKSKTLVKKA